MIKNSIEQLSYPIGFDIGCSDNIVQGNLINGLSDGLLKSLKKPDMQLCYITQQLNNNAKKLINELYELYEFIKLDKENK